MVRRHPYNKTDPRTSYPEALMVQMLLLLPRKYIDIWHFLHYSDVIMGTMASQITILTIVYSTIYSGADQRKHHSSASLAFVRGIHRWPVNSRHKWPVTRKIFPFGDVIMGPCLFHCTKSKFRKSDDWLMYRPSIEGSPNLS